MSQSASGPIVATALEAAGFTHVVWVPDSHIGTWEDALLASPLKLIRACREGEAVAIAAGLMLGGGSPVVMIQCTGFFEAGDAMRNVVYDLGLPLKLIVGVRSWRAFSEGKSADSAARLAEPMVRGLGLPMSRFDGYTQTADELRSAVGFLSGQPGPFVLLWAE
jgi:sulfopyruvate decarboxylase TPP-binding subunit